MKKIILLLLLSIAVFTSCEKDDICSDPTTPRLMIAFYDSENPAEAKNVTNLKVIGIDKADGVIFNPAATVDGQQYITNDTLIGIPLDILANNAKLRFILNNEEDDEFIDTLEFNYTRREQYVSRACGFKTLFTLNSATNPTAYPVILNNVPRVELGNWIKDFEILQTNINTENDVHLKIYF